MWCQSNDPNRGSFCFLQNDTYSPETRGFWLQVMSQHSTVMMEKIKMIKKKTEYELSSSRVIEASEASEGHAGPDTILDSLIENTKKTAQIDGVVIGKLTGFDASGSPLVDFYLNTSSDPVRARAALELLETSVGRQVAIMFENSDPRHPIVMGLMHLNKVPVEMMEDSGICVIEADKEILFRCGKSSILLKENGEIEINGRDILSRASRNHRLKGGTIHLN